MVVVNLCEEPDRAATQWEAASDWPSGRGAGRDSTPRFLIRQRAHLFSWQRWFSVSHPFTVPCRGKQEASHAELPRCQIAITPPCRKADDTLCCQVVRNQILRWEACRMFSPPPLGGPGGIILATDDSARQRSRFCRCVCMSRARFGRACAMLLHAHSLPSSACLQSQCPLVSCFP